MPVWQPGAMADHEPDDDRSDDEAPPDDPTGGAEPIEPDGTVDPDDTAETRSMQGQLVAEGASAGLAGMAVGAVLAAGATIWLRMRRRR